ncbi:MAG: hypothetical protein D6768_00715 [Chloroflexi bacterium]|nr:MAG: hypothetical protein D6768_00715 [Chloroflexota bacterium]
MNRFAKILVMAMTLLVLFSFAGLAMAQEPNPTGGQHRDRLLGEVTAVGDASLTISARNGQEITVNVTTDTKIRLVKERANGDLADIEVGNFVGVLGTKNDDGSVNARRIVVLPENPKNLDRVRGKVTAIEDSVIVVETKDGQSQRIATDDQTRFRKGKSKAELADIAVGDPLLAIGRKQDDGTLLARLVGVVTGQQLLQHTLRGQVLSVDADAGELTVEARGNKEGTWTVQTTGETKYRIRGVENPSLENIEVGNTVAIIGRKAKDADNTGVARVIAVIPDEFKDSIRVVGDVTAIEGTSFTLNSRRGSVTVLTTADTRYRTRGDAEVSFADISVGQKVLVIGPPSNTDAGALTVTAKVVGIKPPQSDRDK